MATVRNPITTPTAAEVDAKVARMKRVLNRELAAQDYLNGQLTGITTDHTASIDRMRGQLDVVIPTVDRLEHRMTAVEKGSSGFSLIGFIIGAVLGAIATILAMGVNRARQAHTTVKGVKVSFNQVGFPSGLWPILLVLLVALICGYAFSGSIHKKPKNPPPPPPAA